MDAVRNIPGLTEEECVATCDWNPLCVAATMSNAGNCLTSTQVGAGNSNANHDTWVKGDCPRSPAFLSRQRCVFARLDDVVYNDQVLLAESDVAVESEAECRRMCLSHPHCVIYSFVRRKDVPSPGHGCLTYRGTGAGGTSLVAKAPQPNERWTTATLAFCARAQDAVNATGIPRAARTGTDGAPSGECVYRKRAGGHPGVGRADVISELPAAGPRDCARFCDAMGWRCALFVISPNTTKGSGRPCILTERSVDVFTSSASYDTYVKESCGPVEAQPCRFARRAAGSFASTGLVAAGAVGEEEECQDLCEAEGEACVAYDYAEDGSGKTCALLASVDLSAWTPDATSTLRVAGHKHFCADGLDGQTYQRFPNWTLETPGETAYLLKDAVVVEEAECQHMCSVFPAKCRGFAFRDFENEVGDGGARCSLYSVTSWHWTPTTDGQRAVSMKKEPPAWRAPGKPSMDMSLGEFDVFLPSVELDSFPAEKALRCGHACGRTRDCWSFVHDGGLCRLFSNSPPGTATGRLWASYHIDA